MKSTQKIKRVTLKISENTESVLFGIVAAEPDYKLSLAINRKLGISLKNGAPVQVDDENDSDWNFSRFSYFSTMKGITYDLVSNRSGKNFLIKKMKNIDYIFHVHDVESDVDSNKILSMLREIDCVTAALKIDPGIVKDKNLQYIIH